MQTLATTKGKTATLSQKRLAEIEALIADKKIAQLDVPGGMRTSHIGGAQDWSKAEWLGDEGLPLFLGYPDVLNVANLPFDLILVREDAATHCKVYVRETGLAGKVDEDEVEDSNVTETSVRNVPSVEPPVLKGAKK